MTLVIWCGLIIILVLILLAGTPSGAVTLISFVLGFIGIDLTKYIYKVEKNNTK